MVGVSAGAAIWNERGEVLLVRHTYGAMNWEIPGGAGEPGESPVETALREVLEETGLRCRATGITGWYYDASVDKLGCVVLCEVEEGQIPEPDQAEVSECRFWPVDDLPRPISDWTLMRIRDGVEREPMPLPTVIGPRVWL
jgi:8-oxo-dGTP diphosphatase